MRLRSLIGTNQTRQLVPADDVAAFEREQARSRELGI